MNRPKILHVSGDFPDSVDPAKTLVIRTLLELTDDSFEHHLVSINRKSPGAAAFARSLLLGLGRPQLEISTVPHERGIALEYEAPAKGLFHATMLRRLGDWLAGYAKGKAFDLIVGHKLSIEGIAVERAARALGIPYALAIQGDTDLKILGARPDLARRTFAPVFHGAAVVFPFTPWALRDVEARLGVGVGRNILLPCPTDIDRPMPPVANGGGLVTVFHLRNYRRKNLRAMVRAVEMLGSHDGAAELAVIGGGSDQDRAECSALIGEKQGIILEGPMDREPLRARLNRAAAFVLPSRRETFGLVFIEALFCGLPVIYPRGAAIDGYFDGMPFAIPVDARDPDDIARAMHHAVTHEKELKQALAAWQSSEDIRRFSREVIGNDFTKGLNLALNGTA